MFDFSKVENTFDEVPAGHYTVSLEGAEWKQSQAGNEYLNLKMKIISEDQRGRFIFKGFHLFHEKAANIAKQQLLQLLEATGAEKSKLTNVTKDMIIELIANTKFDVTTIIKNEKTEIKKFSTASMIVPDVGSPLF